MLTIEIMNAMQKVAAAVKYAYHRRTHDHIDHETMLRAEAVERYLEDERRAGIALRMAAEAKEVEAQQAPTKAGGLDADMGLLEKCRELIRQRQEAEASKAAQLPDREPGAFGSLADADVFGMVEAELKKARERYPFWPADIVAAAAIASEESGEVIKATNEFYWSQGDSKLADIRAEAVQAIAMWVRFLTETPAVDNDQLLWNRQVQGRGDTLLAVFAAEELQAVQRADGFERQAQAATDTSFAASTNGTEREEERQRVRQELILIRAQVNRSIEWLENI